MKKFFVVLLMLVYGLSSTGMTVSFHYCCGKLDAVSFASVTSKECAANAMMADCCKSKHIDLKVKGDQEATMQWHSSLTYFSLSSFIIPPLFIASQKQKPVNEYATGPPLRLRSLPIFLKNKVVRI